jgi:hypothetical protein
MFDRRHFVLTSCFAGLSAGVGTRVLAGPAIVPSDLKAIVTIGGRQIVYDGATGEDMGSYVGEFVQQRCFRVLRPELPLTVFFRPDVVGDRLEVVFELGRMWIRPDSPSLAHITDPYSVEIVRGRTSVAKIDVPYHWWWSRWRWQSTPRPVVRKPSSLIASSLLPPYGELPEFSGRPHRRVATYEKPMGQAHLQTDWGNTGERPEIGPITETQADYILSGSSSSLSGLIAEAEACASAPIHWRDERTGAFIDFQAYPSASENDHDARPLIPSPPLPRTSDGKPDSRHFRAEPAHAGALAYVPFLLTDDPYYLEELQALGELGIGFSAFFRSEYKLPGLAQPNQTRSFAWSLRSHFQLGVVSPEKPPRWLLPKGYWRKNVANSRAFIQLYMDSPARIYRYFRCFPSNQGGPPWQANMVSFILAWGVMLGYSEWKDAYRWQIAGPIAQSSGKSGWNRQWPVPVHWYPLKTYAKYRATPNRLFKDNSIDAETCRDWSDAWTFFKSVEKIDDTGWDGQTIMEPVQSPAYYVYLLGSMRMAMRLGIPDASEIVSWLQKVLPGTPGHNHISEFKRWSVLPP